jgi:hypothetical protein
MPGPTSSLPRPACRLPATWPLHLARAAGVARRASAGEGYHGTSERNEPATEGSVADLGEPGLTDSRGRERAPTAGGIDLDARVR